MVFYFSTADPYKTDRLIESSAPCYHCYIFLQPRKQADNTRHCFLKELGMNFFLDLSIYFLYPVILKKALCNCKESGMHVFLS